MSLSQMDWRQALLRWRIQFRRGTTEAWASADPILLLGEPGWDQSVKQLKIGDGTTTWNDLPYVSLTPEQYADLADILGDGLDSSVTTIAADVDSDLHAYLLDLLSTDSPVASVNGHTGVVVLTKTDIGLSAVPNLDFSDASNITTGLLPSAVIPPVAIVNVTTVASQAAMLALTAQAGDVAIRTDLDPDGWFMLTQTPASTLGNWIQITAAGAVTTVNGYTGSVVLTKTDIGLGNVDNTSDATKQAAFQTAYDSRYEVLSNKATSTSLGTSNTLYPTQNAVKSYVDTADALLAPKASPTFTGVPAAPTAAVDTNTTQVATTAYVVGQGYLKSATAATTYAPLAGPALTGVPTAPTAAVDTNTTQLATTAYVIGQGYLKSATAASTYVAAASPALTGVPTAPTASPGTNSIQIATTAYADAIAALKANLASPTFTGTPVTPALRLTTGAAAGYIATSDASGNMSWAAPPSGAGDVTGPAGSIADRVATFSGTSGKVLLDGGMTIAELLDLANATGTLGVTHGGTGRVTSSIAYGILAAGTTATGVQQTILPGTSGHFLKSAGAASLAAFAAITESDVTNLVTDLAAKAPLASPSFTGGFSVTGATASYFLNKTVAGSGATLVTVQSNSSNVFSIRDDGLVIATSFSGALNAGDITTGTVPIGNLPTGTSGTTVALGNHTHSTLAPLASPVFTGNPTAPTPTAGDNDTSVATTAFVATSFAPLASPTLTGTPAAPTAAASTDSTQIATTAHVKDAIQGGAAIALGNLTGAVNMSTVSSSALNAATTINANVSATFTGNVTLDASTMPTVAAGTQFTMKITQDGTGGRTLTLTSIKKPGGALTLSTAIGAIDIVTFYYDGTNWFAGLFGKAFA